MSDAGFAEFMDAQLAAILASGLDPEEWIEQNAAAFRASWEASH